MGQVVSLAGPDRDRQRELENAIIRLLRDRPFYGHFLMNFRRELNTVNQPVGATIRNGLPILGINPDLFGSLTHPEQVALLEHGLKHVLHLHPTRRKSHHEMTWDVATDLAINPTIQNLPETALYPGHFKLEEGLAAEEYASLLASTYESGNLFGEGAGTSSDVAERGQSGPGSDRDDSQSSKYVTIDDHSNWSDAASTPEVLAEQVVRDLVRDAFRKSDGEVPNDVRELVDGWLAPSAIPWREVLRQFVATAGRVGKQSTWKREHRRFAHDTPGARKRKRLNLLIGIDTSESTDILELREAFARELLQIAKSRDTRLTVLYANSRIKRVETFTGSHVVAEVYRGGGFTDLRPVFDYARTMQPFPTAVIYLTDGYGEAPEKMEFPTLWALTIDGEKPVDWGVELRLQV